MASVLTAASILKCQHGGLFTVNASQDKLKAGEQAVLVQADFLNKPMVVTVLCPVKPPCAAVVSVVEGLSKRLKIGPDPDPVVLDTARGSTDRGTWTISAVKQTKLGAT